MIYEIDSKGTFDGFKNLIDKISNEPDVEGLLILSCEGNKIEYNEVNEVLKKIDIPLFGGVFPGIIHSGKKHEKGTIVFGLSNTPDIHIVKDLSTEVHFFEDEMDAYANRCENGNTMFLFVDGYSQNISSLIDNLYNTFGTGCNYIGSGAGAINPSVLDMTKTPCIFTNDGFLKDSAVLAMTNVECGVGVGHGWHKISGPFKVTETEGNAIKSLDWKPAFEVYRNIIKEYSEVEIQRDNFFEIAKSFPFGIACFGSEITVRDPFTLEGDSIIVATQIPQESFVDILTGNSKSILYAAGKSSEMAMENFKKGKKNVVFLIDCVSRALYLDDDFNKEVDVVNQEGIPLLGILSLGEIANNGTSYMQLYNKTCVVGVLGA